MALRSVFHFVGILVCTLSLSMVIPMLADLYFVNNDWKVFASCIVVTSFFGGSLVLTTSGGRPVSTPREVFLLITVSWLVLCFFAALPLWFCELGLSFTDALFESVSGLTTTGASILTDIERSPHGILLWRSLLQWLGGIGVILMALSVMPFLRIGGMQLFQTELSESEKALPRSRQLASSIGLIYVALTMLCVMSYYLAGLSMFDSIAHAMSTIATGGYSTKNMSFAAFNSPWPLIVGITFMIAGGLPFVLYMRAFKGNLRPLFIDSQVRWFLSIIALSTITITSYLVLREDMPLGYSMLHSTFNIVSLMTGSGFSSADYGLWGGFVISLLFFLMVMGACAGSTTCGIKVFRFQVLYAVVTSQMKRLLYPNGVFIPHYNGKPIPEDVPVSVMGFFFVFSLCFVILAVVLSLTGLDFITAMSGAASAMANVGPGFGDIIGPAGNYEPLPDASKWALCAGMILGRLEIYPILVMFSSYFWRS